MPPLSRPAPAKVNLGLRVLRRRADGYHEIESVFLPLRWSDGLRAEPAPALALTCSDPELPTDGGNLVWRAAEALAEWAGREPGAALHLDKRVPYGAGLGSGSSDAASTLRLLTEVWALDVPEADLHRLATGLGADVPFFLDAVPAVAEGIGERLTPLLDARGEPYRCPFWLVVAVPPVHVSTGPAYGWISPDGTRRSSLADAVRSNDLGRWRREVTNDFEAPVAERFPEVARLGEGLREAGAGWAALSGSGSSVVAACEREADAEAAARWAREAGARVHVESPDGPA